MFYFVNFHHLKFTFNLKKNKKSLSCDAHRKMILSITCPVYFYWSCSSNYPTPANNYPTSANNYPAYFVCHIIYDHNCKQL